MPRTFREICKNPSPKTPENYTKLTIPILRLNPKAVQAGVNIFMPKPISILTCGTFQVGFVRYYPEPNCQRSMVASETVVRPIQQSFYHISREMREDTRKNMLIILVRFDLLVRHFQGHKLVFPLSLFSTTVELSESNLRCRANWVEVGGSCRWYRCNAVSANSEIES